MGEPETWKEAAQYCMRLVAGTEPCSLKPRRAFDYMSVGAEAFHRLQHNSNDANIIADKVVALLVSKQLDYGPRALSEHGINGIRVRMWDKMCRLEHMDSTGSGNHESVEDTLMDLVGYAVLATMFSYSMFDLPLLHDWQPPHPAGYVTYKAPPTPAHHKPKVSVRKENTQIRAQDVVQYGDEIRLTKFTEDSFLIKRMAP
jgi:hypothetical protein